MSHDNPVRKQLRDLQRLESVLFSKEGRPDLFVSKDSLIHELDVIRKELDEEMDILEQFKIFSKFISDIGCGHTQLHPNRKVYKAWLGEYESVPIDYFLIGRKLVTNELEEKEKEVFIETHPHLVNSPLLITGTEIVSINDHSIDRIMRRAGEYLSSDEDHISFKYYQARHFFEFYRYISQLESEKGRDSIKITYISHNDTLDVNLALGRAPVNTMNKRIYKDQNTRIENESDMGQFKVIRNKYGYFRFKSFAASSGRTYHEFLVNAFRELKDKDIQKLVIDLRGNTGGVMQYELISYFTGPEVRLGSYIVSKPHKTTSAKGISKFNSMYFRHIVLSKKQEQEIRDGKFDEGDVHAPNLDTNLIYNGQVVVITDEGTFSSAAILASHLKTLANAKIVGRTAGGSFYGGNSGTLLVKLPNSKFTLLVNPNTFKSQLEPVSDPTAIKIPDKILNPEYKLPHKLDAYYFKEATRLFN